MSFGAAAHAAQAALPRRAAESACPCGGGVFGACCGPIIAGSPAPTPERLMRSRFTAFAIGDPRHLGATWHPRTAPASIDLDDAWEWRRLQIIGTSGGGPGDDRGTVEFRAHWRVRATGAGGALHEVSRFRRVRGRWFYLDGDVAEDAAPR